MEESELKSLTINQLRRLSTQLGVSGAGKKVELIDRIISHSSSLRQESQQPSPEVEDHVEQAAVVTVTATEHENRIDDDVNVIAIVNDDRWSMSAASSHATTDLRWIFNQMQSRLRAVASTEELAFLRRTFGYPDAEVIPKNTNGRLRYSDSNDNSSIRKRNGRSNLSAAGGSGVEGKKLVKKSSKRMPSVPETNQNTTTVNSVTEILMHPESTVDAAGYEGGEIATDPSSSTLSAISGATAMMNRFTIHSPTSSQPPPHETTMQQLLLPATVWPPPTPTPSSSSSSTWRDVDGDRYGQPANSGN